MDYKYFVMYHHDLNRMKLQDEIVTKLLLPHQDVGDRKKQSGSVERKSEAGSVECWLTYLCGAYGSGKSHSVRKLWPEYLIDHATYIDPDALKSQLSGSSDLHKEATFVALLAERVAINRKMSVVIDGSLNDHNWYTEYFTQLRQDHPEYNVCIVKVECELSLVKKRCTQREQVTGRHIPEQIIENIYTKIPKSFDILRKQVDCTIIVNNTSNPIITEIHPVSLFNDTWPKIPPFLFKI